MTQPRAVDPSISREPIALDADDLATVCVLCSHNCGIRVDVRDGRITEIRADERNPITQGYICNKAVTVDRYAHHDQRTAHPLRRTRGGSFEQVPWGTAIGEIAAKLKKIHDEHGPRAIALVGIGGQANHMDAPFASSFLNALGSRRWFNAYAQEKTQHHLVDHWMFGAPSTVFLHPDLEHTRYLVVMGTNPRISNRGHNPNETFKALAKREDCTVVVVDPRETETTRGADRHLRVRPGSDAYLLLGMAAAIVQNELYDAEFLQMRTEGFAELRDVLARVDVEEMGGRCGLTGATVIEVATGLAQSGGGAIMYDLGVEQTPFSTLNSYLIRLILVLTGNIGREGGNHFMESMVPPSLGGAHRDEAPEIAIASGIAAIRALGNIGMFSPTLVPEEIMVDHPERIRAVIVEGANPLLSYSDTNAWREALARLDLLVVIDPAFTETAELAHYVLPTPCGYEKWEISAFPKRFPEIDVQLRPPVIPAPADTLPEPEIYTRLAEAMGITDPVPDELRAAAADTSAQGRAMFLMTAMSRIPDLMQRGRHPEAQMLFWAYRALAHHFPAPSLAAVWLQAQGNAGDRRDAVLRTLGSQWEDKTPLELGEELYRLILAHPEGVEIARVDPGANLEEHLGFADKRIRTAPSQMLGEIERALEAPAEADADYPFVLASGLRTRWTANTIQRDPAWRKQRGPHCEINLAPPDAQRLGVAKGDLVRIETRRGAIELPAAIDTKLSAGHCWMPNGFGVEYGTTAGGVREMQGANCNEITDAADRDPFTGCPHHRYVRVQLRAVAKEAARA